MMIWTGSGRLGPADQNRMETMAMQEIPTGWRGFPASLRDSENM